MLINKGWTWTIADVCIDAPSHGFIAADIGSSIYADNSGTWALALADNTWKEWTRLLKKICNANSIVVSLDRDILEVPVSSLMESTFTWTLQHWDFLFTSESEPGKFTDVPTSVSNPMAEYIDANHIRFYPYRASIVPGSPADIECCIEIENIPVTLVANTPLNLTGTTAPSIIGSVFVSVWWTIAEVEVSGVWTTSVTLTSNSNITGIATITYKKA